MIAAIVMINCDGGKVHSVSEALVDYKAFAGGPQKDAPGVPG